MALLYGYRPRSLAPLKYLSPYEFTMYWEPQLLHYPRSRVENEAGLCEAKLTPAGVLKLTAVDIEIYIDISWSIANIDIVKCC